jgi:hypothetical protein
MPSVIMLSVIMLGVIMLGVIMLGVIMLGVSDELLPTSLHHFQKKFGLDFRNRLA